jgi:hypothetical protein
MCGKKISRERWSCWVDCKRISGQYVVSSRDRSLKRIALSHGASLAFFFFKLQRIAAS